MKLSNVFKNISISESVLLVVFIIYLIFPIHTPHFVAPYIESPLGMIVILCVAIYLFVYSSPVLAVLFLFVAYELLRRSSPKLSPSVPHASYIQYTPDTVDREEEMHQANMKIPDPIYPRDVLQTIQEVEPNSSDFSSVPVPILPSIMEHKSLEEELVNVMAPIGKSEPIKFLKTDYLPVMDNAHSASFI